MILKCIVEIPMGSKYKYEINKKSGYLKLDRVISKRLPYNYGYLFQPNTLCEDGDSLDVFVCSNDPIPPKTIVMVRILGVIEGKDGGVQDDKLLGVLVGEEDLFNFESVSTTVKKYLETYKTGFDVESIGNESEAVKVYKDSVEMYRSDKLRNKT